MLAITLGKLHFPFPRIFQTKHSFPVGNTGDGKTTMAISLMVAAFDEDECLLITSPEQWDHVDSRAVSAVLMDDIFGSGSLDEKLLMQWESKFDEVVQMYTFIIRTTLIMKEIQQ